MLRISDVLPSGLTYVSGVASFGVWSFPDWTLSSLDIGATETLLVTSYSRFRHIGSGSNQHDKQ